jgi:hypothetical protein
VGSLKMTYVKYWSEMSETGQGLVDNDQADQMTSGSDMKNIWGALQDSTCPNVLISLLC